MILFREHAKELGCKNVEELGDLAVWNYIMNHQRKYHQKRIDEIDAFQNREVYDGH
jgi:hypothetical protein